MSDLSINFEDNKNGEENFVYFNYETDDKKTVIETKITCKTEQKGDIFDEDEIKMIENQMQKLISEVSEKISLQIYQSMKRDLE